jgi:hypothetical protein
VLTALVEDSIEHGTSRMRCRTLGEIHPLR